MVAPWARASVTLLLLAAGLVAAQGTRYENQYGPPVDVSIDDLVTSSSSYEGRAVRTSGTLDIDAEGGGRIFALRSRFGERVRIVPASEIAGQFEDEGGLKWLGQEVQVTGVFGSVVGGAGRLRFAIQFWGFLGPPKKDDKGEIQATLVTLEALLNRPGARDGQTVKVVGKFRGKNLYGDLPARSQRTSSDWVIKDDLYAVWVTGKKPKGSGWELETGLKRDTGKWVEVIGRPDTRNGITYIQALRVNLATPPTQTAEAQPPPPPPERPKVPPVVVFALPLDGERDVPRDSRFFVQFSKDMDEQTFKGRVVLRYLGPPRPGDRDFGGLKLSYDGGRRALMVDPGDVLRPGRLIELMLLPGIVDLEGLALTARPGKEFDGAVDVLRFQVGT